MVVEPLPKSWSILLASSVCVIQNINNKHRSPWRKNNHHRIHGCYWMPCFQPDVVFFHKRQDHKTATQQPTEAQEGEGWSTCWVSVRMWNHDRHDQPQTSSNSGRAANTFLQRSWSHLQLSPSLLLVRTKNQSPHVQGKSQHLGSLNHNYHNYRHWNPMKSQHFRWFFFAHQTSKHPMLLQDGRKNDGRQRPKSAAVGHPQLWVVLVRKERLEPRSGASAAWVEIETTSSATGGDKGNVHINHINMYMYICIY